jgi:hypothetical protein
MVRKLVILGSLRIFAHAGAAAMPALGAASHQA